MKNTQEHPFKNVDVKNSVRWINNVIAQNKIAVVCKKILVFCDGLDISYYPHYLLETENEEAIIKEITGKEMQSYVGTVDVEAEIRASVESGGVEFNGKDVWFENDWNVGYTKEELAHLDEELDKTMGQGNNEPEFPDIPASVKTDYGNAMKGIANDEPHYY